MDWPGEEIEEIIRKGDCGPKNEPVYISKNQWEELVKELKTYDK